MDILSFQSTPFLENAAYLFTYVGLFFFSKFLKDKFSSYDLDQQLTHYDNVAVSVSAAGYFLAITIIFLGAAAGTTSATGEFATEWMLDVLYSIAGILLLQLSRWINAKAILYKFSVDKEIVKDQNPGTGVVEGAVYVASALVIGGSMSGEGAWWSALVFYALGQVCLIAFAWLYVKLSPYSVHDEIERDNTAAGLGFAGGLISIGIILNRAVSGDFVDWSTDLTEFGLDVLIVFVFLAVTRLVFDKLILRKSDLHTEIANDQNLGAGLLEMVVSISFSCVLYAML
ncbi:DUF350 domain-containing protein [Pontibacter sp. G13]|uniref:DUF350 domain-containing protein n=1 Tax=Pontibacter sp. G13 TaxID=3074898 RepID=UPI0028895B03|nr:DUF350 domain-containing protein [Pontibacter sp. G13]WNJ19174.1 DUF350 domain-containing protein [Pontibacter sp. G13]